ncbi:hypothetical protein SAMN04487988_1133 [Algoriphagus hitonicola]|uniref:Polymerase beta nucleotidyltransferase domain-containing protein n=2 Tax=Algoriphagus hitonicola TaxID=435880 RepID=A0A1I2WJU2_9BACT|nr:hypothetical protein SAMN04487988_1133 [Algoriphagus hitonicola]
MIELVKNNLEKITTSCKKHRVASLFLFGSAANGTLKKTSDIDFLVEFFDDINVLEYADNYFSLLEELQGILNKKVDLVSTKSLKNPILKQTIDQSKVDLYAA